MPMPTTGPQTSDGMGMAKAMGGTRSNGNPPQSPVGQGGAMPSMPYVPNMGLQFTPKPAAPTGMMQTQGAGLQQHGAPPPAMAQNSSSSSNAPQASNFGTPNFIGNPALNPYGYTATTGQKSDGTEDKYMAQQQGQVQRSQDNLKGAVAGYGDQERQKFHQQVGQFLGDQNSIGGLRSGGVEQGLANFGDQYGREIGDYAAMTAGQGQQQGLEANAQIQGLTGAAHAKQDKKKSGVLSAIGSGLGLLGGIPGVGGTIAKAGSAIFSGLGG